MTENLRDDLQCFIDTMNKEMEGKIITDNKGFQWIFRNGRWQGMCHVEPISFEQRVKLNPMPTKTVSDEKGYK